MNKNVLVLLLFVLFLATSCKDSRTVSVNNVSLDVKKEIKSSILFSKDNSSYFYDIQLIDSLCFFADDKSDTILRCYKIGDYLMPFICINQKNRTEIISKPKFINHISKSKEKNTLYFMDNEMHLKKLIVHDNSNLECSTIYSNRSIPRSLDYNFTSQYLYGTPLSGHNKYSFYYYNPDSGFYWIRTSPEIKNMTPADGGLIYGNNLCVSEIHDKVVTAYRFVNFLSFYDLSGVLEKVIQIGENISEPIIDGSGDIDALSSIKYFIDTSITSKYVYCLYAGCHDFAEKSKIFIFEWTGEHVKTLQLDRSIRNFTVDNDNKYVIAIASDETGGQDVVLYYL